MRIITSSHKEQCTRQFILLFQPSKVYTHMIVYSLSQQFYAQNCLAHVWHCSIIEKS